MADLPTSDIQVAFPRLRRLLPAALLVFWVYFLVVLNPFGTGSDTWSTYLRGYLWMGATFALPCLLSAWAGLEDQPLTVRLPRVVAVGAFLGLCVTWGETRNDPLAGPDFGVLLFNAVAIGLQSAVFASIRAFWGWSIGRHDCGSQPAGIRFTLAQALIWTAGIGAFFGLVAWTTANGSFREGLRSGWHGPVVFGVVTSLVAVPLVTPGIALLLSNENRWKTSAWMAATSVGAVLIPSVSLLAAMWASGVALAQAMADAAAVLPLFLGFMLATIASLFILRLSGYRLKKLGMPTRAM